MGKEAEDLRRKGLGHGWGGRLGQAAADTLK
jgi:hypothetical protein